MNTKKSIIDQIFRLLDVGKSKPGATWITFFYFSTICLCLKRKTVYSVWIIQTASVKRVIFLFWGKISWKCLLKIASLRYNKS